MPNPSAWLRAAGLLTLWWTITYFTLFVGFFILLSKIGVLAKPVKEDLRAYHLTRPE
jgi:hypothetical protein